MGTYEPAEPLARLIKNLEKGRDFSRAGGQTIDNAIMVSTGITLLEQTTMFNEDIREWIRQTTDLKIWANYKKFFH